MKLPLIVAVCFGLLCSNSYALDNQIKQLSTGKQTKMQSLQEQNKSKGEAFLVANKSKTGVITLADGLQYKIIIDGKGEKPKLNDTVTVHYSGTLINGAEFDSSYKRKEPTSFPVNAVIPGWVEALQLMKVGSTWELYIPSDLAYGAQGPSSIGPNQVLIFKVELLGIKK